MGSVAQAFNPSTQNAKVGGSLWIWGKPRLYNNFNSVLSDWDRETVLKISLKTQNR